MNNRKELRFVGRDIPSQVESTAAVGNSTLTDGINEAACVFSLDKAVNVDHTELRMTWYEVFIKDESFRISGLNAADAASLALQKYLRKANDKVPAVVSTVELATHTTKYVFVPMLLADLGLHNESKTMLKNLNTTL